MGPALCITPGRETFEGGLDLDSIIPDSSPENQVSPLRTNSVRIGVSQKGRSNKDGRMHMTAILVTLFFVVMIGIELSRDTHPRTSLQGRRIARPPRKR